MINLDLERSIIDDQGIVGPAGFLAIDEEFGTVDRNFVDGLADLIYLDRVSLLAEFCDERHDDPLGPAPTPRTE